MPATQPDRRPVVILGMPRSGTTLLRRLLNQHPALHCPGESFLLTAAARFLDEDRVGDGLRYGVRGGIADIGVSERQLLDDLYAMIDRYMSQATSAAGKRRWVMKTAVDSFHLPEVETLCGERVRYMIVLRHALDVIESLKDLGAANRMILRELHAYVVRTPYVERAYAEAWRDVSTALLDLAARRPDDVVLCRFEELVEAPAATLDRILCFLGEESLEDPARALASDLPSGIGDWKTYATTAVEPERAHLWRSDTRPVDAAVAALVNDTLVRAGYERLGVAAADAGQALRRYEMMARLTAAKARKAGG